MPPPPLHRCEPCPCEPCPLSLHRRDARPRAQVHAPLGLFVYTPLIYITGKALLTGDGVSCYAANPDAGFLIVTYELEVWLYTTYTAMMCVILYLACGKVVLKSFGVELL